jgi:hypothetical protein
MQPGKLWNPPSSSRELRGFIYAVLSEELEVSRISSLLIDQLAESYTVGASHMRGIIDAIKTLEGIGTPTNAKPPTPFERPPLRGLWHMHYLSALFLPQNLAVELVEMGDAADERIAQVLNDVSLTVGQKCNLIAHAFTVEN